MAKTTLALLLVLTAISSLLVGVNIGKKTASQSAVLSAQDAVPTPTGSPTFTPSPTLPPPTPIISRKPIKQTTSMTTRGDTATFTNKTCAFSFTFPTSYQLQKTENETSKIFADPQDPKSMLAVVCQPDIPKPPVAADEMEATTLGGTSATRYHDKNPDGSPRDEIIVHHPDQNTDIILAGWGPAFDQAVSSFTFLP